MTARIAQQVIPRASTNFRSSLRWTNFAPQIRPARVSWRRRKLNTVSQRGSINHATITMALGVMALGVVALLGFFYLQQVIGTASQGGDVQNLESQIVQLKQKQHELEVQGAELRSLKTIEGNINQLNLVSTDKVSYLANTTDKVALNK